jgi:C_GCAxxG_C_C family probable redox protein
MEMEDCANKAVERFAEGFNCAQAMLLACSTPAEIDPAAAAKLAAGLGGGLGRQGNVCGAVTGAILVLGLRYGAAQADDKAAKENTYRLVREFTARFQAQHGSILCRELLGCDIGTPDGLAQAKERGLFGTRCPMLVRTAAEILEQML